MSNYTKVTPRHRTSHILTFPHMVSKYAFCCRIMHQIQLVVLHSLLLLFYIFSLLFMFFYFIKCTKSNSKKNKIRTGECRRVALTCNRLCFLRAHQCIRALASCRQSTLMRLLHPLPALLGRDRYGF